MSRLLDELAAELRARRYRPLPARRPFIPKPGTTEQRPLSIPDWDTAILLSELGIGHAILSALPWARDRSTSWRCR